MSCVRPPDVKASYANEFSCTDDDIAVEELGSGRFRVTGCQRTVFYTCANLTCVPDQYAVSEPSLPTSLAASAGRARESNPSKDNLGIAHVEKTKVGSTVSVDLRLDGGTLLKLRAVAEGDRPVEVKIVRLTDDVVKPECELASMVDGERIRLSNPRATVNDANDLDHRKWNVIRAEFSGDIVRDLAVARQFAFRVCDDRWSLPEAGFRELHHFAALYEEEHAWVGPASESATGGLVAPRGGWPAWGVATAAPAAVNGPPLEAPALFKLLSPSVFRVIASSPDGTTQGSAVAFTENELLTNCHVVQGAQKIVLQQGKTERKALISRSKPAGDRCVLRVQDADLIPIHGVRSYGDLQIGEALVTLGSPSGLELSLATGILSGKREDQDKRFVQTTAPISPGSSGGGLFDSRGNLVGITTSVLADRNHLNQALNFAIPADAFWSP